MRVKEEMTKIVAAIFVEYIEMPRTLSAFNPGHSAAKKRPLAHRQTGGVRITKSRSMKRGSGSRRGRRGGRGEEEDEG